MNTIKSVYYGWATLIVAGGGAYFFAKRSINADRAAKAELDRQKRVRQYEMEFNQFHNTSSSSPSNSHGSNASTAKQSGQDRPGKQSHARIEESSNPSIQASQDPAPPRQPPEEEAREKSKYEANVVYRSRKGDRFS